MSAVIIVNSSISALFNLCIPVCDTGHQANYHTTMQFFPTSACAVLCHVLWYINYRRT